MIQLIPFSRSAAAPSQPLLKSLSHWWLLESALLPLRVVERRSQEAQKQALVARQSAASDAQNGLAVGEPEALCAAASEVATTSSQWMQLPQLVRPEGVIVKDHEVESLSAELEEGEWQSGSFAAFAVPLRHGW